MWPFKRKKVETYKPSAQQKRHYQRFMSASADRLTEDWTTESYPIDQHIKKDLHALRARSRELARNNEYARRFLNMVKHHVIGPTGIKVQAQVMRGDNRKKLDDAANDAIEAAWADWGKTDCTVDGRYTWLEVQQLAIATIAQDGEFLAIKHIGPGKYGYQLELLDPELINTDYDAPMSNGSYIRMGIEYNRRGEKLAYHLRAVDEYGNYMRSPGRSIPAQKVIHAFISEWIGQSRGLPWLSNAARSMKLLDGYQEAAITAARVGASNMGFIQTDTGEELVGDGVDSSGYETIDAEPGTFRKVGGDVTGLLNFDPDYPHQQYADFVKANLRTIASSLGCSYNLLANDLEGVNYSSMRAGSLEEREFWKSTQEWLIDSLIRPVYTEWVERAVMKGAIKIGQTPLRRLPHHYLAAKFQARRWDWVDPQKDIAAHEKAVSLGIKSRSQIIRENGQDPHEVWREMAAEQEEMKSLGLEVSIDGQTDENPRTNSNAGSD